ncbi:MAG: hypothetical protein ABIN18_28195, partial [Pseudomonadota bacterium]
MTCYLRILGQLVQNGVEVNDFGEVVGVTKSSSTGVDVAVRLYDPEGYAILLRDFPRALKSPWTYS